MNQPNPSPIVASRRQWLQNATSGFGFLAFAGLNAWAQPASALAAAQDPGNPLSPKESHFPSKAKHVIFLTMAGAPSHVDMFDYKPSLKRDNGKAAGRAGGTLMGSPFSFSQHGESGLWLSELFPNLAKHADRLCLLNSMHGDSPNHPTAQTQLHTGNFQFVRPSLGAWTLYGLGTDNASLPGFVSLNPPAGNSSSYRNAFLPAVFQGTKLNLGGNPGRGSASNRVPDINNPMLNDDQQRKQLDFVQQLNQRQSEQLPEHPGIEGVIQSYELAFRMQDSLPELLDLSKENQSTLSMYGANNGRSARFGTQCLIARRMVEAGVRFVEVQSGGWDHHNSISNQLPPKCEEIDQPIAALIQDLAQRGLLEETLIVWSGEFGRTPFTRNGVGRDHNNRGFSAFMVGGGVKGGLRYGATDEHGIAAVEKPMHIHDFHATILHLLGLDHKRLTYRYAGRDFRLTDVHGEIAHEIIA
ncbi:MAG: DUF1501 domain-containing protein [Planctomycetaceae bacterium]|nr:DUF1501 domain-containing protein [Planctomycetaceae bacterium]